MRLNLGCGTDIREGYVNIDFRKTHPSVMEMDLSKFPWDIADNTVDEILMLDFLEHFPYRDTKKILLECYRIMRDWKENPNAELVIQVPDGRHLACAFGQVGSYMCNRCGGWMKGLEQDDWTENCPKCSQSADSVSEAAMMRLYGGQDYPGNWHQACFTTDSLSRIARTCGLYWDRYEEQEHQRANWNFKSVFKKGDVW